MRTQASYQAKEIPSMIEVKFYCSESQYDNIINFLKLNNIEPLKEEPIKFPKSVSDEELSRLLSIICEVKGIDETFLKTKLRKSELVEVRKIYGYISKMLFPYMSDYILARIIKRDRSTLTTHKLELSMRLNSRVNTIPENVILKKDIEQVIIKFNQNYLYEQHKPSETL